MLYAKIVDIHGNLDNNILFYGTEIACLKNIKILQFFSYIKKQSSESCFAFLII